MFWAKRGWVVLICAAITLVATFMATASYRIAAEFDRTGVWTQATLTQKRIDRGGDSNDYLLTFRFKPKNRALRTVKHDVSRAVFRRYVEGQTYPLRYLPSRPHKTELSEGDTLNEGRLSQIVALVSGVIGLVAFWIIGAAATRAIKARRHGQLQLATVTGFKEHETSGTPTGKGYMIWKLDNGKRGESLSQPIRPLRAIGVGSKINVYVRDGDSFWEGDVGPRPLRRSKLPRVRR